mgnify:CR=1 FL=1
MTKLTKINFETKLSYHGTVQVNAWFSKSLGQVRRLHIISGGEIINDEVSNSLFAQAIRETKRVAWS